MYVSGTMFVLVGVGQTYTTKLVMYDLMFEGHTE